MKNLIGIISKGVTSTGIMLASSMAFAGGASPDSGERCYPTVETVVRTQKVRDRGGYKIPVQIVLEARRCENVNTGAVVVTKILLARYQAPRIRGPNDGAMLGSLVSWQPTKLHQHPQASTDSEQVAQWGITLRLGFGRYPESSLTEVPDELAGPSASVKVFGDAFPTHFLTGPFNK